MTAISQKIAIQSIVFYQKRISPHKGYCCAHRALHNGISCSEWVKRLVMKVGVYRSFPLVIRRFKACASAYNELNDKMESSKEENNENNTEKSYNPCTDKDNAACCVAAMPCWPGS